MPSPGKPSQVPLANRPRSATRSKSRSPVAASAKPRSARRTRKQMMLDKVEELRVMIEENCDMPAGAPKTPARRKSLAASVVPTLVPYAAPASAVNPFNSPPQLSAAPATMVPMTLGNAFAKPATKAKTPKVAAAASAMPASAVAVPASKRGGPKPSLRANQEGSWNKFLKNWMAAHPGMKRPDAMKAAGENWKAFKAGKTPAAAGLGAAAGAAVGAAAAAAPLSALGEAEAEEEAEEEEEEEEREAEENLGLL